MQDKQFGGLKYDGLFQCVLGGRSDLRAGTDTFGKDKAPAGPRYGASGASLGCMNPLWNMPGRAPAFPFWDTEIF